LQVGEIENFDISPWIKAANILTAYDDPMLALELLELLPGFYRDNIPQEVTELKQKIWMKLATPTFYANNIETSICSKEQAIATIQQVLRGQLVAKDVKELNDQGIIPHIFELAPGPYWLPIGLRELGLKFTYFAKSLNPETIRLAKDELGILWAENPPEPTSLYKTKNIFVAFEIIEHLHHVEDIAAEYYRYGMTADIIHISTPNCTFDGRASSLNWFDKDLGHLRTFTPDEFSNIVLPMFHGFSWLRHDAPVMHLRGEKWQQVPTIQPTA